MDDRERRIRAICEEHGLGGLGVIALTEGLTVDTTRKLALYFVALLDGNARRLAATAADLVVDERRADRTDAVELVNQEGH